jgi:hypothetical protein
VGFDSFDTGIVCLNPAQRMEVCPRSLAIGLPLTQAALPPVEKNCSKISYKRREMTLINNLDTVKFLNGESEIQTKHLEVSHF